MILSNIPANQGDARRGSIPAPSRLAPEMRKSVTRYTCDTAFWQQIASLGCCSIASGAGYNFRRANAFLSYLVIASGRGIFA